MVTLPAPTPVTTPVASTVAIEALLLLHVPPLAVSTKVITLPAQTVVVEAVMLPASVDGYMVSTCVAITEHPNILVTLYVIVTVPALTPVRSPELASMVAIEASLLLHVPPVVALDKVMVLLLHKLVAPVIALTVGVGLTLILTEATSVPQLLVTL